MHSTESSENYLETILILSKNFRWCVPLTLPTNLALKIKCQYRHENLREKIRSRSQTPDLYI